QMLLCSIFTAAFWLYGRWWQCGTRGLYLPNEYPLPIWMRWLCAEFNRLYGLNPYAVLFQVPPIIWLLIAAVFYLILPSAGAFAVFSVFSLVIYLAILWYVNHKRIFK